MSYLLVAQTQLYSVSDIIGNIEGVFVILGIVAGGLFALWRYRVLREKEKAELELRNLQIINLRQAAIEIQLTPEVPSAPHGDKFIVPVLAVITNHGNRNTYLDLRNATCIAYEVQLDGAIGAAVSKAGFDDNVWAVRAGGTIRAQLFVPLPESGLYLLDLSIPLDDVEMLRAQTSTGDTYDRWTWTGQTHVNL